ncbi:helix-turn-helix transcriptional regulator [Labilibaculum manganireducens]|uniref:helix-turn-helix domain-containing protein n=1 Tax=Labilibaculum manganireducens TaxID=1940525 RepID=UPI0029F584D2|nr:helix-turn-helix transcriptional regulator [Labilibaculum manganireducens]
MFLGIRIKELREEKELLQRQLAASLEIDTPMYSKIERGERKAKREQVIKLAELFEVNSEELLALWLAGQVFELVKEEETATKALKIIEQILTAKQ